METSEILNSTKREINATFELLKMWECLDGLSESDKDRLLLQLNKIAECSIDDFRMEINNVAGKIANDLYKRK